jgi:hypothetical protein
MFRFDVNLFDFYKLVKEDGELSWCAVGTGRTLRGHVSSSRLSRRMI